MVGLSSTTGLVVGRPLAAPASRLGRRFRPSLRRPSRFRDRHGLRLTSLAAAGWVENTEAAVFDPNTGVYTILGPNNGVYTVTFDPGDIPAPADYLGNGSTQPVVFRPSTGQFIEAGGTVIATFGQASADIPLAAPLSYRTSTDPPADPPGTGTGTGPGPAQVRPGTGTGTGTTGTGTTTTGTGTGSSSSGQGSSGTTIQRRHPDFNTAFISAWHQSHKKKVAKKKARPSEKGCARETQKGCSPSGQAEGHHVCQPSSQEGHQGLDFAHRSGQETNARGRFGLGRCARQPSPFVFGEESLRLRPRLDNDPSPFPATLSPLAGRGGRLMLLSLWERGQGGYHN